MAIATYRLGKVSGEIYQMALHQEKMSSANILL